MIIEKLPRFLNSWVEFEVKTMDVQGFLNSCLKNNITVYNLSFIDNGAKMSASVHDYKRLQRIKVRRKIINRYGIRFFVNRYKNRIGFVLGCALLIFTLIFLSGFVWNIDVTGNDRISDNLVLETLKENGVYIGAKKSEINIRDVKRKVLNELYDISWMTINIDGSFAHIEIKERGIKPISEDKSKPSNLISSDDGEIIKMEITKGKPIATVGSGVKKGDLLVAGFYNDKKDNLILEHSSGKVTARLNISKTFSANKNISKVASCKKKTYYSVNFANNKLDLFLGKYPIGDEWTSESSESNVALFGLKLPFTIGQTTFTKEIYTNYELTAQEAKKRILDEIDHFEKEELYECKIQKKNVVWKMETNNKYTAIVDYVFEKNMQFSNILIVINIIRIKNFKKLLKSDDKDKKI